jgi:RNA polymerase sigma factor (sigma-70 family)
VGRISDDERSALHAFAAANFRSLYQQALLHTRNPADAEDLVQETLMNIAARWSTINEDPLHYARRAMRNIFIDQSKKRRVKTVALVENVDSRQAHSEDPLRTVLLKEGLGRALSSRAKLSSRQWDAFCLKSFDGLTFKAIGATLFVSESTARNLYNDARRTLGVDDL